MMQGKFITLEGTEGAGKSTALQFIKDYLTRANIPHVLTREPGGTPVAENIRHVLLYPESAETIVPETELLLMFAGRMQHIRHVIEPALQAGKWVVSDRYVDASYAYQGGGRGINQDHIQALDKMTVGTLYPDLTLLFDIPVQVGAERAAQRGLTKDRIEKEKLAFFTRVRQGYLERAKEDPKRIKIINAGQSLQAVQDDLSHILDEFLKRDSA